MAPFNRRDSAAVAAAAGVVAVMATLGLSSEPWPLALGLAAGVAVVTMLALSALLRRLPPDLPLRPLPEMAARQAIAPPPQGIARLRIALLPELGWYRLDLCLDGVRLAQLRPGTAVVLPVLPGAHVLTVQAGLRRLGPGEAINALPGTDTDIVIRGGGGRSRQFSIARQDLATVLAGAHLVLVAPP